MTASLATRIAASQKGARTRARMKAHRRTPTCPCGAPRHGSDCYCAPCRAAYMRAYRKGERKVARRTCADIRGFLAEAA